MRRAAHRHFVLLCFILSAIASSSAQQIKGTAKLLSIVYESNLDLMKRGAIKVFLDCESCDLDFLKKEITFVNYVRDRKDADTHILITTQQTGSGGIEHTINFIGLHKYSNIRDTLTYVSQNMDTADEIRRGLSRVLKLGLIPFVYKTPIADKISIAFSEEVEPTAVEDKWNFWVFNLGLNGSLSGEKSIKSFSFNGNLSANRVTPESKLRMSLSANFDETDFDIGEETISSYSDSKNYRGLYVKSLSDHWSLGGWISASSTTYSNTALSLNLASAVEYSFFPYSESTRRQLRFLYRIGYDFRRYREETIYEKTSENLLNGVLSVTFEVKEPWGNASATLEGSHYFHDLSKNRLELFGTLSLSLFKGFSLSMMGGFSSIHDQLSLPRGGATLDEILLRRKELATYYSYFGSIGLSYTFGSVFSNVVNPRFGR